jgi:hypothetical protein
VSFGERRDCGGTSASASVCVLGLVVNTQSVEVMMYIGGSTLLRVQTSGVVYRGGVFVLREAEYDEGTGD